MYRWLNAVNVIMLGFFLFIILNVLLKLLTAQLCDTYTNVQNDAKGTLFISNIIFFVTRAEQSNLLAFVSNFYVRMIQHSFIYRYTLTTMVLLLIIHG